MPRCVRHFVSQVERYSNSRDQIFNIADKTRNSQISENALPPDHGCTMIMDVEGRGCCWDFAAIAGFSHFPFFTDHCGLDVMHYMEGFQPSLCAASPAT